ncbi:hypothetical protein DFH06DRAFT_1316796 [Mycena polygramma]|nr:hypothetical protein DFH06DRAFT_1316796 [Mycena polygramma]
MLDRRLSTPTYPTSSIPHSPAYKRRPILPTALFLHTARPHARLVELIKAGTYICPNVGTGAGAGGAGWRGRAATVGSAPNPNAVEGEGIIPDTYPPPTLYNCDIYNGSTFHLYSTRPNCSAPRDAPLPLSTVRTSATRPNQAPNHCGLRPRAPAPDYRHRSLASTILDLSLPHLDNHLSLRPPSLYDSHNSRLK